ncbi:putative nuclease HARBI1 [Argopecten irradians]|uniref:putative nuclease HARBI1 n=1 Tax=Argopecten irradians TaxID=31199 RepID=UPI00371C123B
MKTDDEPTYVCRKGFHAINMQGVVDADMFFLNMNCKYPGSTHDAYIYQNSSVPETIDSMSEKGHLLGDSGYPLREGLLTPFNNPSTPSEINYNKSHCKTRNIVERSFGVLKSRFRCLHPTGGVLPFRPSKCAKVLETCVRLHNKAMSEKLPLLEGGVVLNQHDYIYRGEPATRTAQEKRLRISSRF